MIVGNLGGINFIVSKEEVFSINNSLKRKHQAKITEHSPIYGPNMLRHQGRELQEITFTITLINGLTEKGVVEEKNKLLELMELGKVVRLVLSGQIIGDFPFLIKDIEEEGSYFVDGIFRKIELSLSLKEYIENPKEYNEKIKRLENINFNESTVMEDENEIIEKQNNILVGG